MRLTTSLAIVLAGLCLATPARAKTICTAIADAAGTHALVQFGDCTTRVTPASTFKVALALMGYDAAFLKDATSPELPFREGYADYGGDAWRQTTEPTRWMKYSVVWYSQQIAQALGNDRLHKYARAFGYGNADFTGDSGKNNGLERAWIASSVRISPLEQIKFLQNLVSRKLAVRKDAFDHVNQIVEITHLPDGWDIHAKTGTAYPRKPDYTFDESKAYGWFIGWANKGPQTFVFARLIQDEKKEPASAGARARDSLMRELPSLLSAIVLPRERSDKHDWREEKCRRYKKAWASLLLRQGSQGLGKDFLETHDRFLTSNCEIRAVCPHSPEEFEAANNLVMLSMGFGTASTFPPFACGK